ncbi:ATP-dependent DNA ligase [Agromyces salentinus]|nr:ATP-dependent DNA ligase [Agromyces salentinus]
MGTLTYDSKLVVSFDDRVLAHLQSVIWAKLRRGEYFAFTWTESSSSGFGRTSVWISPSIPLAFEYFGGRPPRLNGAWVQALTKAANSASGLILVPEPADPLGQPAQGA